MVDSFRYYLKYRIICGSMFRMNTKQTLAALSASPQESRLAVFRLLVQTGPDGLAASKIGERLDIAPSSCPSPQGTDACGPDCVAPGRAVRDLFGGYRRHEWPDRIFN
jgi:hypothetical protein